VDVVLEVALFDPIRTAATGRRLGIESDALTRFERGVDPAMVMPGTEYATRLILELCGGRAGAPIVAGVLPEPARAFRFRINQLKRLAGIALEASTITEQLRRLGFEVAADGPDALQVTPPSWRHDVNMEADIVEELVRHHGYDRVPPMPVRRTEAVGAPSMSVAQQLRGTARRTLAQRGLVEAVTWSFIEPKIAARFGDDRLRLRNPIHAELSVLRPSLLPNLLSAVGRNQSRGQSEIALFEVGARFFGAQPGEQEVTAGGLRVGHDHGRHWAAVQRPVDVYDARADALAVLAACKVKPDGVSVAEGGPAHYHPGRRGRLMLGPKTVLAEFGELHPAILKAMDLEGRAVAFELFLDRLPKPRATGTRGRTPLTSSAFQPGDRDFAFGLAEDVPAESLLGAVRGAEKNLIRDVTLFDVYVGAGLGSGQKSIAVAVRLQAADHTLTEAEIDAVAKKITTAAHKATGAVLRS
jgi:phenylalanyl-tRNA synthetase beta chain